MEKQLMDAYIDEFLRDNNSSPDVNTMKNLLRGNHDYSFSHQIAYEDPDCLEYHFRNSVQGIQHPNLKDVAIRIYIKFFEFLNEKGISAKVEFPPSNNLERYLYIAKFLHNSEQKIDDLPDKLWVSKRTIEDYIKKLRGLDNEPIQFFNKDFSIPETERSKGRLSSASTVHPLLLTLNLTQVLVILKGLKAMSENRLYENYAKTAAAEIWEQLSDYAKKRINFVLSELLPDDLAWYESLEKSENNHFVSEYECSINHDVIGDCLKNNKRFCIELRNGEKYSNCHNCSFFMGSDNIEYITFTSDEGKRTLPFENILRSAYTPEELTEI